jgi:hypothetical protein
MTLSRNCGIRRWQNDQDELKTKDEEWSYCEKMATCEQNAETSIQLRSRRETILNVLHGEQAVLAAWGGRVENEVRLRLFLPCGLAGLLV